MKTSRRGSALLFALVILVVLTSLMMSFLFRIRMEQDLTIRYRTTFQGTHLARAGQEMAKVLLIQSLNPGNEAEDETGEDFFVASKNLQRGLAVNGFTRELGEGSFTLYIQPESGRRNINLLSEPDWRAMLEDTGVPDELHDELISNFLDWTDPDEANRLKGAESDDAFYEEAGYPTKNAPIDTLNELLLIKGFTRAIVYGGALTKVYDMPDVRVRGFANLLTVYGTETVNLNAVNRDVLFTISGLREDEIDALLEERSGLDGIFGTEDDGYSNVNQALAAAGLSSDSANLFSVGDRSYVRVLSIGEVGGFRSAVWTVYEFSGRSLKVLSYREDEIP